MPKYKITSKITGYNVGVYECATPKEALDAMARSLKHEDLHAMLDVVRRFGLQATEDDWVVTELNHGVGDYLGDGVYVEFDGYGIWVRANHHRSAKEVYLEPETLAALNKFYKRCTEQHGEASNGSTGDS